MQSGAIRLLAKAGPSNFCIDRIVLTQRGFEMPALNERFMLQRNSAALALDGSGLWVEDRNVIKYLNGQFVVSSSHVDDGATFRSFEKVASLLNSGNKAEAIFLATFALSKAGFNQDELRGGNGRWAKESGDRATSLFHEVADNNSVHDALVNDIAAELRKRGDIVETEIRLSNLLGVPARGDIMVKPLNDDPYLLEVKTGLESRFRPNQILVYRDMCLGPHVYSPDEKIANLGFKPYIVLPRMRVYFHLSLMGHHYYGDYCDMIGVGKSC